MKRLQVRIVSLVLAAAMVLPIAACNKKNAQQREKTNSGKKISADMPWFTSKTIKVAPKIDTKKPVEYTMSRLSGTDNDHIAVYTSGFFKMPTGNNINWEKFDFSEYSINLVTLVDKKTGETVSTIDLSKDMAKNGYVDKVTFDDGKLTVRTSSFDDAKRETHVVEKVFDPDTGKELEKRELSPDVQDINYEKVCKVPGYTLRAGMTWDDENKGYYVLHFFDDKQEIAQVDIREKGLNLFNIPAVFKLSDTKILVPAVSDKETYFFEVDLVSFSAKSVDAKDYSWLKIDNVGLTYSPDEGQTVYFSSPNGISKIDMTKKTTEELFNYSWSDVNRANMAYLDLAECSDDSFLFCGSSIGRNAFEANNQGVEFMIVTFEKAASNPHAGKTIIELYASYGFVNDQIGEAIKKFNDTNGSHFIEVRDRYIGADRVDYTGLETPDEYEGANLKSNAKMSNELAMDILNGEGPDILLNTANLGQLNNSNYLVDLNKYIGTLDSDKYFTNIVKAAEYDGKLYQLPFCFMIDGIHTDSKYAGKSGVGFTTDEYKEFVNKTLNGADLIQDGQGVYFTKLFTAMNDKFIVNGKVDFTGPEFEALANYVKDNVREKSQPYNTYPASETMMSGAENAVGVLSFKGDKVAEQQEAFLTYCYGVTGYLTGIYQTKGGKAILGIPSSDGRGPEIEPYVSIAVSAQSKSADACGEFVKMLLSDEIMLNLAKSDNLVLNRKAFREGAKAVVEYCNGQGGDNVFGSDPATGGPATNRMKFTEKDIDNFEAIILSCSRMNSVDAAINLILIEEMPAYFSGQKDLQSVIKIAQDRAQKVVSERG